MKLVKLHFAKKEYDAKGQSNGYVKMGKSIYVNFDLVKVISESGLIKSPERYTTYSNHNGTHCTYINFGCFDNPNSGDWYQDDLEVYESVDEVLNLLGEENK